MSYTSVKQDTSGALLLAKTPQAARVLSKQFQNNAIKKTYLAVVDAASLASRWATSQDEHVLECHIEYTETGPRLCKCTS